MKTVLITAGDDSLRLMAEKFVETESGNRVSLDPNKIRTWAVVGEDEHGCRYVDGVITLRNIPDVPVFLVKKGLEPREFVENRDALIERALGYAEDSGYHGEVLIGISQDCKVGADSAYVKRMGLSPANRWTMEV